MTGQMTVTVRQGGEKHYALASKDEFSRAMGAFRDRQLVVITEADGSEHAFQPEEITGMHWNPESRS